MRILKLYQKPRDRGQRRLCRKYVENIQIQHSTLMSRNRGGYLREGILRGVRMKCLAPDHLQLSNLLPLTSSKRGSPERGIP